MSERLSESVRDDVGTPVDLAVGANGAASLDDPPTVLSKPHGSRAGTGVPASAEMSTDVVGEMLSQYRLDQHVGTGGMGTVFRATDVQLDRLAALKILPPDQAADPALVERFHREARWAARLDHENIARVFGVGQDRGVHFIAFEFVEGTTVRDQIATHGRLDPADVVRISLQLASALAHAAARGVVHRDVKPSNIIITRSGRVKLVDMGLARHFERRSDGGLTESGMTLGTFDYIAPEQARDPRDSDARSDLYSLGCAMFHMLTGRPPYPEGTVLQKLLKHQGEEPPDTRDFAAAVPARLASLVRRLMAKDPARRIQTAEALIRELVEIAGSMGLRPVSSEGWVWMRGQLAGDGLGTTLAVWGAAIGALLITVAAMYWPGRWPDLRSPGVVQAPARASEQSPPSVSAPAARDPANRVETPNTDAAAPPSPKPVAPPLVTVARGGDLRAAIEQATSRSTLELEGDGTWSYRPQTTRRVDASAGIVVEGKQLVIRAAPGARPRIRLEYDRSALQVADWVLFSLIAADVTFADVRFEVDVGDSREPLALFVGEGTRLNFERCSFLELRAESDESRQFEAVPPVWVAQLGGGIGTDGRTRPSELVATACFFGGGSRAVHVVGPATLNFSECTFLPYRATFALSSPGFPPSFATNLRLQHVSLFGGGDPILDVQFANVRVAARETVVSHEAPLRGVLARVDGDSQIEWAGERNWYHGLRCLLERRADGSSVSVATNLAEFREVANVREDATSDQSETSPWQLGLSEAAVLSPHDLHVADAFRIRSNQRAHRGAGDGTPIGARTVLPWGPLYPEALLSLASLPGRRAELPSAPLHAAVRTPGGTFAADLPRDRSRDDVPAVASNISPTQPTVRSPAESPPVRMPNMEKVLNAPPGDAAVSHNNPPTNPDVAKRLVTVDPNDPSACAGLRAALDRAGNDAIIEIRHNGLFSEAPLLVLDRHVTVRAGAGFRPTISLDWSFWNDASSEPALFDVRRGSLTLAGLDLRVAVDREQSARPPCVVRCEAADLAMHGCAVSLQSPPGSDAFVVRLAAADAAPMTIPTTRPSAGSMRVEVRNTLWLAAGAIQLQSGQRVQIDLENSAIECDRPLLAIAGTMQRPSTDASIDLDLRRTTVRTHDGLVWLGSDARRSWLPTIGISANDNVFAAVANSPWVSIRGTGPTDELERLLRWRGKNNTFDSAVSTFLRVQSLDAEDGTSLAGWEAWSRPGERDEVRSERAAVQFLSPTAPSQPVWERIRGHFRIRAPDSDSSSSATEESPRGADLNDVPISPQERTPAH